MRLFEHLIAFGGELCFDFGTIEPTARHDRLARPGYLLAENRLIVPRLSLPLDVLPHHFTLQPPRRRRMQPRRSQVARSEIWLRFVLASAYPPTQASSW